LDEISLHVLLIILTVLLLISAVFANSEAVLLTLNQYRLEYFSRKKTVATIKPLDDLTHRPSRLINVIQIGKTISNILVSSLTTVIAIRLTGEAVPVMAIMLLTILILIFYQVSACILQAKSPNASPYLSAWAYIPLLNFFYLIELVVNFISSPLIRILGMSFLKKNKVLKNKNLLKDTVIDNHFLTPVRYQNLLLRILDLDSAKVEDIMTHRNDIVGIDIEEPLDNIVHQILSSPHTRLPVYKKNIDRVIGFLHLRTILTQLNQPGFDKHCITKFITKPFFIPAGTSIHRQMQHFKEEKLRIGLVVDEYGDVLGLISMDDLLQELVGELIAEEIDIQKLNDGSYLVDAGISIRDLNRLTQWHLPTDGPKTLNGLIVEHMEAIPESGVCVKLKEHALEIIRTDENAVKLVKIRTLS